MREDYQGFGDRYLTFDAEGTIAPGTLLNVVGPFKVGPGEDGDSPIGVAVAQRGSKVLVQMSGLFTYPYSGGTFVRGRTWVAVNPTGGVKPQDMSREVTVLDVDTVKKTVTFLM